MKLRHTDADAVILSSLSSIVCISEQCLLIFFFKFTQYGPPGGNGHPVLSHAAWEQSKEWEYAQGKESQEEEPVPRTDPQNMNIAHPSTDVPVSYLWT